MNTHPHEAIYFTTCRDSVQIRPGRQDLEQHIRTRIQDRFGRHSLRRDQGRFDGEQFDELLDGVRRYQQLRPDFYPDAVTSFTALQSLVLALPKSLVINWKELKYRLVPERGCHCSRCGRTTYVDKLNPERTPGADRYATGPDSFELVCDRFRHADLPKTPFGSDVASSSPDRKKLKKRSRSNSRLRRSRG